MAGHFFDWTGPEPYTDDPEFAGRLQYGKHNHIFLDGKELLAPVLKYKTGPGGWVEACKLNEQGGIYTEVRDTWHNNRVLDEVEVAKIVWQGWRRDGKGGVERRYEEEIATEVLFGHVAFSVG